MLSDFKLHHDIPYQHTALVTAANDYAVSLLDVRNYLRIDIADDDAVLIPLIAAATLYIEEQYHLALLPQTWDYTIEATYKYLIDLPIRPVQSITSITYYTVDGAAHVYDSTNYYLLGDAVQLKDYHYWPIGLQQHKGLVIRFVAGFSTVPERIKLALKMLIAQMYENRETQPNYMHIDAMMRGYKRLKI